MRQVIKAFRCCLQYEGGTPKAPLCPIVATAPLDLLHVDFTSIETMMELDQSPRVANVLVFQDHFTKHVLAYVTPDQTAKPITKFLYGGYISIFGALARLLSDESSTKTSFFSSHQRLVFPCVWATIIHGTGVPVPPHARLPPQEVMERGHHKRKDGKVVT